jgi:4-alpha-glucanotransferase
MHRDGICTPLSSLKTKESQGIGGFLDLILFFDLIKKVRFNFVQLLPLNDSGFDNSPYNAISNLAFNPVYISIPSLNLLDEEKAEIQNLNEEKRVRYREVLTLKLKILKRIYRHLSCKEKEEVYAFYLKNQPLKTYSIFKRMKEILNDQPINFFPKEYFDPSFQEGFFEREKEACLFFFFLQKWCHDQLKIATDYAKKLNIELLCDLPILVSQDSVEVFEYPQFFDFTHVAGAPPDAFNSEGQYWGFPLYRFDEIKKSNYLMWKLRFDVMDHYFSHFRIDHILGFFRLFSIPKGSKPIHGKFIPKEEKAAIVEGEEHLHQILKHTKMIPIGEDLGKKFHGVDEVLKKLKIAQTKIIQFEKDKNHFIPLDHYPKYSIVSLSNHDLFPFQSFWNHYCQNHSSLLEIFNLKSSIDRFSFQFEILKKFHQIPCLYRVNPIQEYLHLESCYTPADLDEDRINYPGEINQTNWTYFLPVKLETLIENEEWIRKLNQLTQ